MVPAIDNSLFSADQRIVINSGCVFAVDAQFMDIFAKQHFLHPTLYLL